MTSSSDTQDHGLRFLSFLCEALCSLSPEELESETYRAGLPGDIETRLACYLKDEKLRPSGFSDITVEAKGADLQIRDGHSIVASCEMKVGARDKVLADFDCKFTLAIVNDVLKHLVRWPRRPHPDSARYVAVLLRGDENTVTERFKQTVIAGIHEHLKNVDCSAVLARQIPLNGTSYTQLVFRVRRVGDRT